MARANACAREYDVVAEPSGSPTSGATTWHQGRPPMKQPVR